MRREGVQGIRRRASTYDTRTPARFGVFERRTGPLSHAILSFGAGALLWTEERAVGELHVYRIKRLHYSREGRNVTHDVSMALLPGGSGRSR